MRRRWRDASIATRLFVQSTVLMVLSAVVAFTLLAIDARTDAEHEATVLSRDVVLTLAADPTVQEAVAEAYATFDADEAGTVRRASEALQPFARDVVDGTRLDFVTIMHTSGIRYTHPDEDRIGQQFLGTTAPALAGRVVTETFEGTLGPSARAVAPVVVDGEVVGLVSGGVTIAQVSGEVVTRLVVVAIVLVAAVLLAALAAWLLARRLRAATGGRGVEELARLFAAHEAVLHTVDDGLLLVEGGRVVLANDRARTLLGLDDVDLPVAVDDALPQTVQDALAQPGDGVAPALVDRRSLLVERHDAAVASGTATMLTIRDRTELSSMAGELDAVRTLATALRAQTHEFGNRMHTIASLLSLGESERALEVAAAERDLGQRLADRVVGADEEPVIAALLLGKTAQARERAVELHFETRLDPGTHWIDPIDFVTILGNLVDNAIDAAATARARTGATSRELGARWVAVYLGADDDGAIVMQVSDSGEGVPDDARELAFEQGWTTKEHGADGRGFGLALVRQTVERLGGTIELGRELGAVVTVVLPRPASAAPADGDAGGAGDAADAAGRARRPS
ncbi:sensor histidine kinase [Agrococcus sp. SGAir0287]|uniref:sensor histidine kinase n=1 Tax=Agrococcus sp. SGAir0287 TaxID=2070347 RepID=UPI0010CCE3E1|nr:ATP-binding protein [Agrococcus sp. SGAir0287]QCR18697.1 histidine kinase [Agrococcus sp. SGAir0287]